MAQPLLARSLHLTRENIRMHFHPTIRRPTLSTIQKSLLSIAAPRRGASPDPKPHPKPIQNPGFGASSLRETLKGTSRTVKVVLILGLCIAGTAESVFWVKVLMRKFGYGEDKKDGGDEEEGE